MEKIVSYLGNHFKAIEVWQEKKNTLMFEDTKDGLKIDQISKIEYAVRVFQDGKVGFAYLSGNQFDADTVIENLKFSLESSFKDDDNVLPFPDFSPKPSNYSSTTPLKRDVKDVFDVLHDEAQKREIKNIERLFLSNELTEITLYNSNVGFLTQHTDKIAEGAVIVVEKDDEAKIEWDFALGSSLQEINPKEIINRAYERAVKVLNASPTYTGSYPILFENRAASEFLEVLAKSFLGENIYKHKSIITEDTTFSKLINITEDPFISTGSRNFEFDGEGMKAEQKQLVEQGVIKGFLYNTFYGKKCGKKSTANAIRTKLSLPPQNSYSNLYIKNGDVILLNSKLKEFDKVIGVVSLIGMHLVNPVTGDISVGFEGYLLEKGVYKKALSSVTLSGNLKNLFENVIAVGDDLAIYGNSGSPALLVKEMVVTGI